MNPNQKDEKVIVARHFDNSRVEKQGLEITIGKLTDGKLNELKHLLENANLFNQGTDFWGKPLVTSNFLDDTININEYFHGHGMLTLEDLFDGVEDREGHSTDNWDFSDINTDIISIPDKGLFIINFRFEDLYFYAEGNFPKNNNISENNFQVLGSTSRVTLTCKKNDFNFPFFVEILESVSINGKKLVRNELKEEAGGLIYYSTQIIYKDGHIVGWLGTNNDAHFSPFDSMLLTNGESELPLVDTYPKSNNKLFCICPFLMELDKNLYNNEVEDLLKKI